MNEKSYHALHQGRIFIGGATDVEAMIKDENCDVIVELRAEASEDSTYKQAGVKSLRVPLMNDLLEPGQEQVIAAGIDQIIQEYESGHKVGFHCGGGRGRAGTMAAGVLLKLGVCETVDEAEAEVKRIRPVVRLSSGQKQALVELFSEK